MNDKLALSFFSYHEQRQQNLANFTERKNAFPHNQSR